MDITTALLRGLVAGLAVAVPLGAIGLLVVREAGSSGRRAALPAAIAVATVDVLYAIAAVAAGGVITPLVSRAATWPTIVAGALLLAVGARTAVTAWTRRSAIAPATSARAGRVFVRFFALTAVNPATLVALLAIGAGWSGGMAPPSAAAFVVGVATASFGWHVVLIAIGGLLHARSSRALRLATGSACGTLVAVLGASMIWGAIAA